MAKKNSQVFTKAAPRWRSTDEFRKIPKCTKPPGKRVSSPANYQSQHKHTHCLVNLSAPP